MRERFSCILRAFGARCKRALFSEGALQLGCVPWLPPRCPTPEWSLQLRSARAPSTSPGPPSPKVGSLNSRRCLARASLRVRHACLSRVSPCSTGSQRARCARRATGGGAEGGGRGDPALPVVLGFLMAQRCARGVPARACASLGVRLIPPNTCARPCGSPLASSPRAAHP